MVAVCVVAVAVAVPVATVISAVDSFVVAAPTGGGDVVAAAAAAAVVVVVGHPADATDGLLAPFFCFKWRRGEILSATNRLANSAT